jgi:hypothetical protein
MCGGSGARPHCCNAPCYRDDPVGCCACLLLCHAGQWQRSSRRLTPSGQYVKLILSIQEAGALADLLSCFDAADVVLASATLADVQALVAKLKEQLPKLEAE